MKILVALFLMPPSFPGSLETCLQAKIGLKLIRKSVVRVKRDRKVQELIGDVAEKRRREKGQVQEKKRILSCFSSLPGHLPKNSDCLLLFPTDVEKKEMAAQTSEEQL